VKTLHEKNLVPFGKTRGVKKSMKRPPYNLGPIGIFKTTGIIATRKRFPGGKGRVHRIFAVQTTHIGQRVPRKGKNYQGQGEDGVIMSGADVSERSDTKILKKRRKKKGNS